MLNTLPNTPMLVGERTKSQVASREFAELALLQVAGRNEPVRVYAPLEPGTRTILRGNWQSTGSGDARNDGNTLAAAGTPTQIAPLSSPGPQPAERRRGSDRPRIWETAE